MTTPEELLEARTRKFAKLDAEKREAKFLQWAPLVISILSLMVAVIALFHSG
ncbi:hypothetical protein [Vitreimonas sp.]|uniref:hypothetical protein n=1 Tax=Vitreimonas sp. TaxID=3069702 RepID=UPI002ED8C9BD